MLNNNLLQNQVQTTQLLSYPKEESNSDWNIKPTMVTPIYRTCGASLIKAALWILFQFTLHVGKQTVHWR